MTTNTSTDTDYLSAMSATIDFALEALDIAQDGKEFTAWTHVSQNQWGGFDIRNDNAGWIIRVTEDDGTWTIREFSLNMVERGSQTFTGRFAQPVFVGMAVNELL